MSAKDRLVIDSRLEAVSQAREWVAERARQARLSRETIGDLKLVLTEAVTNVVRHSYAGESGHQIILSWAVDDETLTLTVRDFGRPFDPSSYQPPDLSELQTGGYGVFLIQNLMDEVRYDTSEEGNTLTLVKRRDQDALAGSGQ